MFTGRIYQVELIGCAYCSSLWVVFIVRFYGSSVRFVFIGQVYGSSL